MERITGTQIPDSWSREHNYLDRIPSLPDLPNPGIKLGSPALQVNSLPIELSGKPMSFAWICIFFSAGQVLLCALSRCSACTSVSEGVFLMYLWRETYSMSTYSSAIFVSAHYLIGLFVSLILSCMSCLYISEINPLSVASLANIFSYSEGCTLNFEHAASSIWTSLPPSISLLALYSSLNVSCVFWFWSDF